ncbi:NADH-FMN oxidoreductase RutF, flavin reductase (DIM6/NTAB) family [Dyella jiangningensis]|uniref:flavin reductase n=2 Tax=Gammaproteobacteria TaxID=1236 RepID=UPI00087F8F5D|nr:flavin reductase [Dyella sp. AtDHG13]PXV55912.1 flavin reductase (DIM6/NTAB) family NADH-FMN oxidoreductase RutF [Dyella sp. AtDHG13]SDK51151.1 NADH-FMN oxidoreductase RutF, flavin reductase (DIM6/NTAB) family [Dyella jiangningensis]
MWKDTLRPWVRPLPQWSTVAVAAPQHAVAAYLHADDGVHDVTMDHTVASLKPLVIATSMNAGQRPVIEYCDTVTGKRLGSLRLARMVPLSIGEQASPTLYRVTAGEHHCLGWPRNAWNRWLQNRLMQRQPSSQHALMAPNAVQQLMIAYLCPRPVVLVSVDTPHHRNMFPMDLIGPLSRCGLYSLALRSTNVSAQVMRETGRVALSCIPAAMKPLAYKLSEHHKMPLQRWSDLPLAVRPSRELSIPAVASALCVHELTLLHSQEIGSHIFFLGRVLSDEALAHGEQLHHTPGYYQTYRRRRDMPFAEA